MIRLLDTARIRTVLCLGAHSDDVEIGCGGTMLRLVGERGRELAVHWVVFSASDEHREAEARASAASFLAGAGRTEIVTLRHRDAFFPQDAALKESFEGLKARIEPDLILTHARHDRHQDHRTVSDLTWNTWRDHLVLEYEIPKYDADLGQPGCYVALDRATCALKVELIMNGFPSQRHRHWFDPETFWAHLRMRGIEAGPGVRYAEALHLRKLVI